MDEHKLSRRLLLQGLGMGLVSVASIAYAKKKKPNEDDKEEPPGGAPPPPGGSGQVISGQTFSCGGSSKDPVLSLSGASNRIYRNCIFENGSRIIVKGKAGKNVTFENCIFRNIKLTLGTDMSHLFYVGSSRETTNDNYGLVFRNNQFINCTAGDIFEFKCSGSKVLNNTFTGCIGGVRIRHGVGTVVCGNKGLPNVNVRCGPHEVHNNPEATVTLFAGNLPGRYEEWIKLHKGGAEVNWQCAYRANCSGNKLVIVGAPSGKFSNYPAKECNIAPGDAVQLMSHTGTTRNSTKGCPQA